MSVSVPASGFINVNKAAGVSSAREVAIIKKLTGQACGHLGTLDPMACGVLPVAVGNATRLFDYFLTKRKRYIAEFTFGVDTDTLDTTGTITAEGGRIPSEEEIRAALPYLAGELMQVPPNYSAKNVNGARGYELARKGEVFTLPPKKVSVGEFTLKGQVSENIFRFEIECGGGTYIRSLARDLGKLTGTYAVMNALTRTESGGFKIENSVETRSLTRENIYASLIPADAVLPHPRKILSAGEEKLYLNGVPVKCGLAAGQYRIYRADGSFYGVGQSDGTILKSRLKLC